MYFVTFVLTAQFVLVNVVVAVLMKHLEDSNKEAQLEEMEERAERQQREREREEASRRLSVASVGGEPGPHLDAPAQVKRPNAATGRSRRTMMLTSCVRHVAGAGRE